MNNLTARIQRVLSFTRHMHSLSAGANDKLMLQEMAEIQVTLPSSDDMIWNSVNKYTVMCAMCCS